MWKEFVKYPRNVFPSELIIYNVRLNLLWNWFSRQSLSFFEEFLWHTAGAGGSLWDGPTTPDIPILLGSPPCPIRIGCVTNRIHGRDRCLLGYRRHCSKSRGHWLLWSFRHLFALGTFPRIPWQPVFSRWPQKIRKWLYQWRKCPKIPGLFPGQRILEMEADWPFFCSFWGGLLILNNISIEGAGQQSHWGANWQTLLPTVWPRQLLSASGSWPAKWGQMNIYFIRLSDHHVHGFVGSTEPCVAHGIHYTYFRKC